MNTCNTLDVDVEVVLRRSRCAAGLIWPELFMLNSRPNVAPIYTPKKHSLLCGETSNNDR